MDSKNSLSPVFLNDYLDPHSDAANLNQNDPNINNHVDDGSSSSDTNGDNDGHDLRKLGYMKIYVSKFNYFNYDLL